MVISGVGWIAAGLAFLLLATPGIASAVDESTTTTTTAESSTTTTVDPSSTTTTLPSSTTTTTTGSVTTTTTGTTTTAPPAPLPPEPTIPVAEWVVGNRPAPAIVFPLAGDFPFSNTFGAPRDGGTRRHAGIDIAADKGVPILAVADGVVSQISVQAKAGQYVVIEHDDGWESKYLHLNNDTPGTEDGSALGHEQTIDIGTRVLAGTVIGYVGNSGNAESTVPHLHFGLYQPDGLPINPFRALVRAQRVDPIFPTPIVKTLNTRLVGFLDPDRSGFNADIAVRGGHVFMGTSGRENLCPGTGVRVIDVSDPTAPSKVAAFATGDEFPDTSAEDIWVGPAGPPGSDMDIAVVALRLCDEDDDARPDGLFAGIAIYDVTDPATPRLLSAVHSGESTTGANEIDVLVQSDQVLLAASIPDSGIDHVDGVGDARIYDVTNPSAVVPLSDWDLRRDGPPHLLEALRTQFDEELLSVNGVEWLENRRLVVGSVAGLISLDVADPEAPVYLGTAPPIDTDTGAPDTVETGRAWLYEGSVLIHDEQRLEQVNGEREGDWGRQILYDLSDPAQASPLATFGTENSSSGIDGEVLRSGFYSPRQSVAFGSQQELVAWMSDGVRIVDLTDPAAPHEVGYFVPPPRPDPQGWWEAPDSSKMFPLVWGVATDGDLAYVSDVNSGLWIFEVVPRITRESGPTLE